MRQTKHWDRKYERIQGRNAAVVQAQNQLKPIPLSVSEYYMGEHIF